MNSLKIFSALISIFALTLTLNAQTIEPAPEDKAVVYFVRTSALGALINFTYFDGEKVIGKFNGPKYMRYECQPGEHLFWARSENKSFVKANVEAGKIYIIEAIPKMGGIKAGVNLVPVNPKTARLKKIQKLVSKKKGMKFTDIQLRQFNSQMIEVVKRGMKKYKKMQSTNKSIPVLTKDLSVEAKQLLFKKK